MKTIITISFIFIVGVLNAQYSYNGTGVSICEDNIPVTAETFFASPDTALGHYTIDDGDDSYGNFITIESLDFGAHIQPTGIGFKMYKTGNPGNVYMDICYTSD